MLRRIVTHLALAPTASRALCGRPIGVHHPAGFTLEPGRASCRSCVAAYDKREAQRLAGERGSLTCPACRGTGGGVWNDCPTCDGNGVVA